MRLTKELREQTIQNVINEAIAKRMPELEQREFDLAGAVYTNNISFENMKKMAELPAGYFMSSDRIHIEISYQTEVDGQEQIRYYSYKRPEMFRHVNRHEYSTSMGESRLHPRSMHSYKVDKDSILGNVADQLMADFNKFESDIKSLRSSLVSMIYACNTKEQLLENWPEGETFLPKQIERKAAKLPAVTAEALNKHIACVVKGDCEEIAA